MVDNAQDILNNDDTDILSGTNSESVLSRYKTKEGTSKETINALLQLNKENFWKKLSNIVDPMFKRPGLKSPEKKKYYTSAQILASQSYCVVDTSLKTLVKCKDLIETVYEKPYKFDSLIKKLVDTVAVLFLAHDIKILFSNTFAVTTIAGYVEGNRIVGTNEYVVVNINPSLSLMKTNVNSNTASSLDDVYRNVFTTFAKFVYASHGHAFNQHKHSDASGFVLSNVVYNKKDATYGWFDFLRTKSDPKQMCKVLADKSLSRDEFRSDPDAIYIKRHFMNACKGGEYNEIYADVYGLIVDGLETGRGVKHQKLAYLQPMVSVVKDDFEPSHIRYRQDLCSKSTVVECHQQLKGTLLFSMRDVGEVEEVALRGTLISD